MRRLEPPIEVIEFWFVPMSLTTLNRDRLELTIHLAQSTKLPLRGVLTIAVILTDRSTTMVRKHPDDYQDFRRYLLPRFAQKKTFGPTDYSICKPSIASHRGGETLAEGGLLRPVSNVATSSTSTTNNLGGKDSAKGLPGETVCNYG